MLTVTVNTASQQYPIFISEQLTDHTSELSAQLIGRQVLVISNETVAPLYLTKLLALLPATTDTLILADGEHTKTLANWQHILDYLIAKGHHRDTTLIALGGGVIGDLTGFAAACYQRGVAFIQIPTTLLAQVDAAIGGKTAVNHLQGKNLIGAFHQPKAVFIACDFLTTLPTRQFNAGLAEVIKAAIIADPLLFSRLEQHLTAIKQLTPSALKTMIHEAVRIKAGIVATDETEQHNRALLNFGHTVGHAIEQCEHYQGLLHGEAVAVGILIAAALSQQHGWLTAHEQRRIAQLLEQAELPLRIPAGLTASKLITAMQIDKKIKDNQLRFILTPGIGQARITSSITTEQLRTTLLQFGAEDT